MNASEFISNTAIAYMLALIVILLMAILVSIWKKDEKRK